MRGAAGVISLSWGISYVPETCSLTYVEVRERETDRRLPKNVGEHLYALTAVDLSSTKSEDVFQT